MAETTAGDSVTPDGSGGEDTNPAADTTTTDPDTTTTDTADPDTTDGGVPDATTTDPDTATTDTVDPDTTDGGEPVSGACTAQVEIAFYSDANCTELVMAAEPTRIYDTTQACFSWEGNSAAGLNSATNFRCFKDRLCYTQHPATLDCNNGSPTDKEARTDACVADTVNPDGKIIYAKIIGGTDSCPEPPAGYECPLSEPMAGTPGINACTMEP